MTQCSNRCPLGNGDSLSHKFDAERPRSECNVTQRTHGSGIRAMASLTASKTAWNLPSISAAAGSTPASTPCQPGVQHAGVPHEGLGDLVGPRPARPPAFADHQPHSRRNPVHHEPGRDQAVSRAILAILTPRRSLSSASSCPFVKDLTRIAVHWKEALDTQFLKGNVLRCPECRDCGEQL
jgi:hypothetical protein